jgi:hypothetical protein
MIQYILFTTYLHPCCFCSPSGFNRDFHVWEPFSFYCSIMIVIYLWQMVRNHGISTKLQLNSLQLSALPALFHFGLQFYYTTELFA